RMLSKKSDLSVDPRQEASEAGLVPDDRVRDAFGALGRVQTVDPAAEHGMGSVRGKLDGCREISVALISSGLEKVAEA
ncbi:MAG: hypothetical protein AAF612_12195, partial [Planctomycetota bacterium]